MKINLFCLRVSCVQCFLFCCFFWSFTNMRKHMLYNIQFLTIQSLTFFNFFNVFVQVLENRLGSRCWSERSHVEKKLLVVVCGLSLALFICILTLGLHYNESEWWKKTIFYVYAYALFAHISSRGMEENCI